MKAPIALELVIREARWERIPHLETRLEKAAAAAFSHLPKSLQLPCSLTVLLTTDADMKSLNRDFRGIARPTNVLSFPQFEPRALSKMGKSARKTHKTYIGDIALGYQYMVTEAKKDHKILINHASHLLIHGILHIFGYDHETDADALKMERLETRVMAGLGLADPYKPQPRELKAR